MCACVGTGRVPDPVLSSIPYGPALLELTCEMASWLIWGVSASHLSWGSVPLGELKPEKCQKILRVGEVGRDMHRDSHQGSASAASCKSSEITGLSSSLLSARFHSRGIKSF